MAQTALIVPVPEAEELVGELRARFDASAALGVPAHITVLFPFMAPEQIDAAVVRRIQGVCGEHRSFEFSLARVARFPATTYLEPDPAAPFIALTQRLAEAFPQFPPFGGEFATIVPHLTVAHGNEAEAATAQTLLEVALASRGAIRSTCRSLTLIENASGTWKPMQVFDLARS